MSSISAGALRKSRWDSEARLQFWRRKVVGPKRGVVIQGEDRVGAIEEIVGTLLSRHYHEEIADNRSDIMPARPIMAGVIALVVFTGTAGAQARKSQVRDQPRID